MCSWLVVGGEYMQSHLSYYTISTSVKAAYCYIKQTYMPSNFPTASISPYPVAIEFPYCSTNITYETCACLLSGAHKVKTITQISFQCCTLCPWTCVVDSPLLRSYEHVLCN